MIPFPKKLKDRLDARKLHHSLRSLQGVSDAIDFSSNDYLGFSESSQLKARISKILETFPYKNGSTGSRLLTGNHHLYGEAESFIASVHKIESALIFNSGYDANLGFFSCVPQKGDVILYDEYIHASVRDGIRMSDAKNWKYKHNDLNDLHNKLARIPDKNTVVYVVTESVFSMDGDCAPLPELVELCEKYGCLVVIDEAHAVGVIGENGTGLVAHYELREKIFATIVTFGKALGSHGAAILGGNDLKQYLINFARSLIYTTALPPHSVAAIIAGYQLLQEDTTAHTLLRRSIDLFKEKCKEYYLDAHFIASDSAIQCMLIPGVSEVKRTAAELLANGFLVKPILSPTIPSGSERLRFCLHSYNTEDEITSVLKLLATFAANIK